MSQTVFTTIDPQNTSGSQLATILGQFKDALMSGLIGNTRPTSLQAGGMWVDNSLEPSPNYIWSVKVYTGSTDVVLFKINLATGAPSISGSDSTFNVTKVSADAVGPLFQFIKRRVANNGQDLANDVIGELQFVGRTDSSGDPLVARIRSIAVDTMTASTTGAAIVFETTATAESAMTEVLRIMNRRVGVNIATPQSTLHVKGATGIRHERSSDDAAGATVTLKKSRVAGTGQTKSGDILGTVGFNTTDNVSNDIQVSAIENKAIEDHTQSALGTKLTVRTIPAGTVVSVDQITVQNGVEVLTPLTINAEIQNLNSVPGAASITALNAAKAMTLLTGSTATTIRGIDSTAASKVLIVHNGSSVPVVFKSLDTAANAPDRIKLPSDRDLTLQPDTSISFFYNTASSQWKLRSGSGSGGSDIITTLGDLIVGGTGGYATRLPVGANGYRLVADSTAPNGLAWKAGTLTTKGDILTNDGTKDVRVGVGTDGQILVADSTQAGGIAFATQTNKSLSSPTGTLPVSNGGTNGTTAQSGFNNLAPTSTAGDLIAFDGTNNVRRGIGTQGQYLSVETGNPDKLAWVDAPSGGGFNYFKNGDFEAGIATVQWAKATVTNGVVTGTPTLTTTQGTSSLALSVETTSPLRNNKSLRIAAASAWTQGDGVAIAPVITLQPEDYGKVLTYSLNYQVLTPSNLNFSGTIGSQSLVLAIYDVTGGGWVPIPAGSYGINSSSTPGIVSATFQTTTIVGQKYQMYLFNAGATTSGAVTMLVDDTGVSAQKVVNGSSTNDFQNYTPSLPGFGTVSNLSARWRKNGSKVDVIGVFNAGTTTATTAQISLPPGIVTATATQGGYPVGSAARSNTSPANSFILLSNPGASAVNFGLLSTNGQSPTTSQQAVNIVASGDVVLFQFSVEVQGYSSNVQLSSDTDTRVVSGKFGLSATTASVAVNTAIPFNTILIDTHGAYTSPQYRVMVTGIYAIAVSAATTANAATLFLWKNGVSDTGLFVATTNTQSGSTLISCQAGDLLDIRPDTATAYNAISRFSVNRLSGPSVIASTESINARVQTSATQSIAANTATTVTFATKTYDTHAAHNGTAYVVPVSGKIRCTAFLQIASTTLTTTQFAYTNLFKNGVLISGLGQVIGSGGANAYTFGGSDTISCQAGDQLSIIVQCSVATTLFGGTATNFATFERVGN